MKNTPATRIKSRCHRALRAALTLLPKSWRGSVSRWLVDCSPTADSRLILKIAETREELEACYRLLHGSFVAAGLMQPDPSGLRVTLHNALPSTTTLCAIYDGVVVGTVSMVRQSVFGFSPGVSQHLGEFKVRPGQIAEISGLAVHPDFRQTGGTVLFPLMKYVVDIGTSYFDLRQFVVAAPTALLEMLEVLLTFKRFDQRDAKNLHAAVTAPDGAAMLELREAKTALKQIYQGTRTRQNLYRYFFKNRLAKHAGLGPVVASAIEPPMTPALLDYFFNHCTRLFERMANHEKAYLYSVYKAPEYIRYLPVNFFQSETDRLKRKFPRYQARCSGMVEFEINGQRERHLLAIVDCSLHGFSAHLGTPVPTQVWGDALVHHGLPQPAKLRVLAVSGSNNAGFYGFKLAQPDLPWQKFVAALAVSGDNAQVISSTTRFHSRPQALAPA